MVCCIEKCRLVSLLSGDTRTIRDGRWSWSLELPGEARGLCPLNVKGITHNWFVLCRGIGYAITKNIVNELSHPTVVCTTRSSAEQLTGLIR